MSMADAIARATRASFCMIKCSLVAMVMRCRTPSALVTALMTSCQSQEGEKQPLEEMGLHTVCMVCVRACVGLCVCVCLTGARLCLIRAARSRFASPLTPAWSLASHHSMTLANRTSSLPSTVAASSDRGRKEEAEEERVGDRERV